MAELKLWKFTDIQGNATYIREEDFCGLGILAPDANNGVEGRWQVITPAAFHDICDDDAARLADYLSTFVVSDFTTDDVRPEQLGRWKAS